ncbi:MAG: carboxypeptidase regulatory-like domain-containing protein [Chloroflexi bacterium]|nr:carboxypeptidase regulatory-like domain-containing protein [Chloroflexota bacterium]
MVRFILLILVAIVVLGLLTIGSTVAPCQATTFNCSANGATPIITNATLFSGETDPSKVAFQTSYLSLSLRTDKPVYLTGEIINITVSTSVSNTHVRLLAQLSGGYQETIGNFTTSGMHTLSWPAPATSGQVRFTCEGEALVQVWSTCTTYVCVDEDCRWENYPCVRSMSVTGNAFTDIRVFSRATSISGHVVDTNQRPVPGATVYTLNSGQSTTANNNGYYEFNSYQLGNNYTLINQIPTVTETVSVEAIACEPQPGKTVQVQAERGATDVNFTLKRYFYPPAIDLSEFTFDAFPGWEDAKEPYTWQNILGITIDGPVEPIKLLYGAKEVSPPLFNIDNKKLYLITKLEFGRYFLELKGAQNTEYIVAAATTLNSYYFEPVSVSGRIEAKDSQRLRLMLEPDKMELKVIKPPPLLLIIIPTIVGLVGGLVAAYFLTGGKFRGLKLPRLRKTTQGKAREKTRREGRGKRGKKK